MSKDESNHPAKSGAPETEITSHDDKASDPLEKRTQDWAECTAFVGADPTQVRVFARNDLTVAIQAVPGCNCTSLSHALLDQMHKTTHGWTWWLDLAALGACDLHLLRVLLAIGSYLHRGGGRLVLDGMDVLPIPSAVRHGFLKDCRDESIELRS